ncbi:UMF1 family MFS transporter [Leucobacter exalbidus]|uniref:UMF1 family MFS transporter n=1 Tax=Leucobacter exalbidus TaxID=662960 RepID=A0A940PZD1_9MICO|nr:MFS transporter [Leucobacter exalbidus]MBP1326906.1 UMF1 family MFS transporter [Leucobacter exalbidus]
MSELAPEAPAISPANPVKKRTVFAWSLWDWGSAAFQAVVTTFVFSVYITQEAFGPEEVVSAKLGTALLIAGLAVALLAPVTGQLSDAAGKRKLWMGINTAVVVACTALLVLVAPEQQFLMLGLVLLAIGNVAFEFAGVSYNAMLSQISTNKNVGRVSGFGWGMGYLGGIVLLAILLVGFIFPDPGWFGVTHENGWNVRVAMIISALWFAVCAIPVFFAVPEVAADPHRKMGMRGVLSSYGTLFKLIADLWRDTRQTLVFLVASAVFRDGLAGVFTFGGVIAALSFGFSPTTVIIFAIAANVIAGVATIAAGYAEDRIGAKPIMMWSIMCMVIAAMLVFLLAPLGTWVFWVFGLLLCIFVGPVQSASRSYLSRLIPAGREGEIFGLYATTGRAVSFLAPGAFTIAVSLGGAAIYGILGIALVLLVGLLLLLMVRVPKP